MLGGYLGALRHGGFRRLWIGAVLNLLGDGATWIALAWLAITLSGTGGLVVVTVAYTLPVLGGGVGVGPILDRFDRVHVMVVDSVVRGAAVASVPLTAWAGRLTLAQLALVAGTYGLLKIVPLAAVPAVLPDLVPADSLPAASALESIAYGVAGLAGPAAGGLLIPAVGAANVLGLDALTYAAFAVMVATVHVSPQPPSSPGTGGWRPAVRFVLRDHAILGITVAFMAFNVAAGMLLVVEPWLARYVLPQGPRILGTLLATVAAGELLGSVIAGSLKPRRRFLPRIGLIQGLAGVSFFLLLARQSIPLILMGLFLVGVLSSPLTVMAQVVRLRRTPPQLRGRTITLVRTLMQGATPVGSVLIGIPLAGGHYEVAVVMMATVAALPGLLMLALTFRPPITGDGARDNDIG